MDYTIVLSGPLAQRTPVVQALLNHGGHTLDPEDRNHHTLADSDPEVARTVGWVTTRVHVDAHGCADADGNPVPGDLDRAIEPALRIGWNLRAAGPTPLCRACGGQGKDEHLEDCGHCEGSGHSNKVPHRVSLEDIVAQLQDEVAALKAARS